MKHTNLFLSLVAVGALAACSTPLPPQPAQHVQAPRVTQYAQAEVDEAASAYVALFKDTIEQSISSRQYQETLAYKHMSAEACFESRAKRLLAKEVSQVEKESLILSQVSLDQLNTYQKLSKGYIYRINGLEMLTCDTAGLKVAYKTAMY